jgi:hypothetical protein
VRAKVGLRFPIRRCLPILSVSTGPGVLREVTVPLSEHEQRLLEQMERALYAEDPKFATSMRNPRSMAGDKRRVALGVLGFLIGMGLLVTGVATQMVVVGVLGFLAMLGGIWLAVAALRPATKTSGPQPVDGATGQPVPRTPRAKQPRQRSSGSLAERMEERWRRRRERGDF